MQQQMVLSAGWQAASEAARSEAYASDLGIVLAASLLGAAISLGLADSDTVAALADLALDALRALPFVA